MKGAGYSASRVHLFDPSGRSVGQRARGDGRLEPLANREVAPVRSESSPAALARDGVVDAELAAFVRDHYPRLIRLAGQICREPLDASDAVQNGLEQAWRRRGTLRDRAALRSWLDRTVVREAIRLNRPRGLRIGRLFDGPREIDVLEAVPDRSARHEADAELRAA